MKKTRRLGRPLNIYEIDKLRRWNYEKFEKIKNRRDIIKKTDK